MWLQLPSILWRIGLQSLCRQRLARVPEPALLIEGDARTAAYDEAGADSNLMAPYAFVCDVASAAAPKTGRALDIACGSGQLTGLLSERLPGYAFTGLELSPHMLERARGHFRGRSHLKFVPGNMFDLSEFPDGHFQLTTWTMAAHHTDEAEQVSRVLRELERITDPQGAILVFDLGRLKNQALCQWYINFAARDYSHTLRQEFAQSVYAAYTCDEMRMICQNSGVKGFMHFALAGLPTLQLLLRPGRVSADHRPRVTPDTGLWQRLSEAHQRDYKMVSSLFKRGGLYLDRLIPS